ncbi:MULTISPECIES: LysR substrate-binding domain-containing protein [Vibrio]|uniref:LysR substrate-binding domain-containing protein n=1 Tax=Vibrio TaxID=662 RepID=UPI000B5CCDB6|nr:MULTISPECIES: LysR substrate-binding domain-containing protein [Vibrio]HBV77611.1 LysR family transcriptional regulator [Vibrio sp.]
MNITLKQLKVFTTITQHKTLTASAEKLFLTKAAVSLSLGELERQLGHALFDRVNNRLILNQEGKRLLPIADELLHRSEDINHMFQAENQLHGQLKIGASDTIGNQVAPYLLRDFREQSQHLDQNLFISNTTLICQKLTDYELDIGLIEGKIQSDQLIMKPWNQDAMCVVCSFDHPLASKTNIHMTDLENSQWLLREAGSGSREFFLRTIAPRIEIWNESFQLNTTEAILNATAANLGLACLSQLAAQSAINDQRVVEVSLPLNMSRRFWLLVHKEKYQSPLLKSFMQFCIDWEMSNSLKR